MHELLRHFHANYSQFFNVVSIEFMALEIVHINSQAGTTILFTAYSANRCISVHFFPQNFLPPPLSPSKYLFHNYFFVNKIVQINSLRGAIVLFATYPEFFPPNFPSFFNDVSIKFFCAINSYVNSIRGTIILTDVYSAIGRIFVRFPPNFRRSST